MNSEDFFDYEMYDFDEEVFENETSLDKGNLSDENSFYRPLSEY